MARRNRTQKRRQNAGQYGTPAQLLDSRLTLRVQEERATPASRIINGTARYTDPLKSGTPRQLQPKYGLTFNGTNEYATGPVVSGLTTQATWSVWVNTTALTSPGDYGVIIGVHDESTSDSQVAIDINGTDGGSGSVGFYVTRAGTFTNYAGVTSSPLSSGVWHHVAAVFDAGTLHLYIDGVHQGAQTNVGTGVTATLHATSLATRIGARSGTLANYFDGSIDDIRIYNTALSASGIAALAAMKPGSTSGVTVSAVPLIHYKCEDPVTSATVKNSGSLGASANATITGTVANVRGTVSPVFCWANEVGYTDGTGSNGGAVGELIPRDESNPTKDIAGNDLQYVGQCPRDMVLTSPAVTLNGTNEYITLPVTLAGATSWEFSCRIKTTDTAGVIFDNRDGNTDGYAITLVAGAVVVASDAADVTGSTIDDDAWHELRVVWDGADATIYIDGEVDATGALAAASGIARTTSYIGTDWTAAAGSLAGTVADVVVAKDGAVVGNNPCCEPSGDIAFDISGNGNDGKLTGTIATMRGGSQNKSDVLVKSGYSVGRWYDGTNDSWSRATLVSGATRFCVSCYASFDSLAANRMICAESTATGNQRSFQFYVASTGALVFTSDADGTGLAAASTATGVIVTNRLYHITATFDAGTVVFEVDGVVVANTGTPDASLFASTSNFEIGSNDGGALPHAGNLSQLLIHKNPTAVWTTAQKALIRAAGKPSEIQAIVSGLGGTAWYFPYGDGSYEALQGIPALTHNGASEQRIIPVGAAGIQPTHGPGLLAPGQSLDLYCGQDDAPICQVLAGDLSDGTYDFGDGDEANVLFKRGDANSEELAVITPAASGSEFAVLQNWST